MADVIGSTYTDYYLNLTTNDESYVALSASEWVVTDRLNAATGQNFTSWDDFYGPFPHNGDYFSAIV